MYKTNTSGPTFIIKLDDKKGEELQNLIAQFLILNWGKHLAQSKGIGLLRKWSHRHI